MLNNIVIVKPRPLTLIVNFIQTNWCIMQRLLSNCTCTQQSVCYSN